MTAHPVPAGLSGTGPDPDGALPGLPGLPGRAPAGGPAGPGGPGGSGGPGGGAGPRPGRGPGAAAGALPGLPEGAPATGPAESRGLARDEVRMLVAAAGAGLRPVPARALPAVLRPGDLVVLNTSDTLPAALRGVTADGEPVVVHLSTVDPASGREPAGALRSRASRWVVEVRRPSARPGGEPSTVDRTGARIAVRDASVTVEGPYVPGHRRLWTAEVRTPAPLLDWLTGHGEPVRYGYTAAPWPLAAYRTDHADTPGSAEMPSAGRPVTARVLRALRRRGIGVATVVLHCGLSSPDAAEPPYPEWYEVPPATLARVAGASGRVVAVGTTVVRALESAARTGRPRGWTDLVVGPGDRLSTVDGLLTGWHPPEASHLRMLQAVAGEPLLRASYAAAAAHGFRWHEFGDVHLLLP